MHGLVSLLPSPYYEEVEGIWQELEHMCGLKGIKVTPYPHFSWQIAEHYQFEELELRVKELCSAVVPIKVHTAGVGIFSGEKPVIYIPVVKDEPLMQLHTQVWKLTRDISDELSEYYSPEYWMPHISLAYTDVDRSNIGGVMQKLVFQSHFWEMVIDNISLIYEPDGEIGRLKFSANFNATDEIAT